MSKLNYDKKQQVYNELMTRRVMWVLNGREAVQKHRDDEDLKGYLSHIKSEIEKIDKWVVDNDNEDKKLSIESDELRDFYYMTQDLSFLDLGEDHE